MGVILEKASVQFKADPSSFVSRKLRYISGKSLLAIGRYLLYTGQKDSPLFGKIITELVKSQRSDGGFQRRTRGDSSSVLETAHAVQFLLSADIPRGSDVIKSAVSFLMGSQRPDGGFSESERTYHEVRWLDRWVYVKKVSSPYITSAVLRALLDAGASSKNTQVKLGLEFLRKVQKPDGGWALYQSRPDSDIFITAAVIGELGRHGTFRASIRFKDAISYILKFQKVSGSFGDCLDATFLALDALAEAKYDFSYKPVATALGWVLQRQNPAGSFYDTDCEGQTGETELVIRSTINAIIALSKLGVLGIGGLSRRPLSRIEKL